MRDWSGLYADALEILIEVEKEAAKDQERAQVKADRTGYTDGRECIDGEVAEPL